jgi:hypothetical protein
VSPSTRRALAIAITSCSVYAACADQPATNERQPQRVEDPSAALAGAPGTSPTDERAARRSGCIRGGFTPAEVRAAMGEPDSTVAGWWIYGRTQVLFGYGTVQDYIDDSDLVSC